MKLTDICDFQGGSQPPKNQWSDEKKDGYIRMLQIRDYTQDNSKVEYIKVTNSTKTCKEDDILIARYGASVGKILTGLSGAYNVAMMKVIIDEKKVDRNFIYNFLKSNIFQNYIKNVGERAAQAGFNKEELSKIEINIPILKEQKNIANKLGKVQEIIYLRKKQKEELDELIKSQFADMFGNPVLNEKKWNTDMINNVAPIQNYKGTFENKVWMLNLDMVESNSGRIIDYIFEDIDNIGNSTCTFNEENILYSKLRPYLNKVVIPNKKGFATSELVPLKPNKDKLNRYFLAYVLRSEQFVQYISEKVTGAKMPRVSMDMFRKFKLILPPLELQNKFADFVIQINKQKFIIKKSLKETEELQESLMNKYFE